MSPTTTPRTPAQRAASRLNGSQSHGPTTPDGRRISSRNSTKHGLSGSGLHLPPDMAAELPSEIALFASRFHPRTPYEHDLIRRAALANLRARRISDTLLTLCDDRARTATRIWDETRASEISSLTDNPPPGSLSHPTPPPPHRRRLRLPRRFPRISRPIPPISRLPRRFPIPPPPQPPGLL